jgi:hypothetical protein
MTDPLDLSVVVRARLDLEARRIDAVERMRTDGPSAQLVDKITGGRLDTIVSNQRARFSKLDPSKPDFAKLAALERSTDNVAREGTSLAMGALARHAGLDEGSCDQADRFVEWLAGKGDVKVARMSIPGDAHSVHRSTDVIRRQVPDYGIWDLPVLAHEFGHLAAGINAWDSETDAVTAPVAVELEGLDGAARSQAIELFCDLFATYSLGPSFLCTLVFHRCNPAASAHVSSTASHPSDPMRVFAAERLLGHLRGNQEAHGFDTQLYWCKAAWTQMQAGSPTESLLSDEQAGETLTRVAKWWTVLTTQLSGFGYIWSPTIQDLVAHLRSPDLPIPGRFSPADVLNAVWVGRLDFWFGDRAIPLDYEERAMALLETALPGGDS